MHLGARLVLTCAFAASSVALAAGPGCQLRTTFAVHGRRVILAAGVQSPDAGGQPSQRTDDGTQTNDTWASATDRVEALRSCTELDGGGLWQVLRFSHRSDRAAGAVVTAPAASASTPIASVNVVDSFVKGRFELFYSIGSSGQATDFAPRQMMLTPGMNVSLAPFGGRSSDQVLPMFHLISQDPRLHQSLWIGVGWTGTWRLDLAVTVEGVQIMCGQNHTNLQLLPGESFRTPSVVMLPYTGDAESGFNVWRELLRRHFTPRQPGTREPVVLPTAVSFASIAFEDCNETNQILAIQNTAKYFKSAGVNTYWIDAGWQGVFPTSVGNWTPNATRFPNGMAPVGAAAAAAGLQLLLWFEPERVMEGTELWKHTSLYTMLPPEQCRLCDQDATRPCGLLNLGDPKARQWATHMVSSMVIEANLTWYRQDFNTLPALFWLAADKASTTDLSRQLQQPHHQRRQHQDQEQMAPTAADIVREGISEALHVEGLYRFWDDLRAQHPGLSIDNCASGGRRIDIETLRRSVPLWRSDHCWDDPATQAMAWGLSHFLPFHGVGSISAADYPFRSGMGSIVSIVPNVYAPPAAGFTSWVADLEAYRDDLRPVGTNGIFGCDFFSLTNYSDHAVTPPVLAPDGWIAWQYHNGSADGLCESERGVVLAFRRAANGSATPEDRRFSLRGVVASRSYLLAAWNNTGSTDPVLMRTRYSGAELRAGLPLALAPHSSAVVTYHCVPLVNSNPGGY